MEKAKPFVLEGHLDHMKCPYLIVHGGHDVLGVAAAVGSPITPSQRASMSRFAS